jgi:hypothetical protein
VLLSCSCVGFGKAPTTVLCGIGSISKLGLRASLRAKSAWFQEHNARFDYEGSNQCRESDAANAGPPLVSSKTRRVWRFFGGLPRVAAAGNATVPASGNRREIAILPKVNMLRSLRAARDRQQLLPLHDKVGRTTDERGEPLRHSVGTIAGCDAATHDQTGFAGSRLFEDERPGSLMFTIGQAP